MRPAFEFRQMGGSDTTNIDITFTEALRPGVISI